MSKLFLTLINMSVSAGWLVLCIMLLRLLLKRAPRWLWPVLWALVGLRLALPFSVESALSLIPSAQTIDPNIMCSAAPAIQSGIPAVNSLLNPIIGGSLAPSPEASANPLQIWIALAAAIWLAGMAALIARAAISYAKLRGRVKAAEPLCSGVYQSESVAAPFVLGVFRPRIYLPRGMPERAMQSVLSHERAHIKRRDHIIKPIGYLLLCVYWFNPLLWAAYALLCRDIELACDEMVISTLGREERADYSEALLSFSAPHRLVSACPLAFGEVGVKDRVKSVLSYKKPSVWIIAIAVVAAVAVEACFLTDPQTGEGLKWARALSADDIQSIELVVMPQSTDRQYKAFDGNEFAAVAALANGARGRLIARPEEPDGGSAMFYIKTADGVRHEFGNISNVYLFIDGDYYDAGYGWLSAWDESYGEGNAPLPMGFFENRLTLDDVIALSQATGEALTWADFDGYDYIETGSGLYIRVYEINDAFSLWVGGGSPDEPPLYIRLASNAEPDVYIDIRTGDVAAFIAAQQGAAAISTIGGADGPTGIAVTEAQAPLGDIQAARREQFLALFSDPPRGEGGFAHEYQGDWDGDGKTDRAYMSERPAGEAGYTPSAAVVVELGNGESFTADALELAGQGGWGGSFLLEAADLTGDGQNEMILLIDLGGNGGRGAYAMYPYRRGATGWEPMQTPATGLQLTLDWADNVATVSSGGYEEAVADEDMLKSRYAQEGASAEWERIDGTAYKNEYAADAMCDIALVEASGRSCIQSAQYVCGPTGVHADQLGYLLATYMWDAGGAYTVLDVRFVYMPQ